MKLKLAEGLALPLEAVTQNIAILAKRRAGIRSAADGKGPGLSVVILGGAFAVANAPSAAT